MEWNPASVFVAPEVPFMRSAANNREAGRIDRVLANAHSTRNGAGGPSERVALEVQAVYFSGKGMVPDFQALADDDGEKPPAPSAHRRPDWRSSSATRLMPQRQVKVPTLRQWGKKLAVAVDELFFSSMLSADRAMFGDGIPSKGTLCGVSPELVKKAIWRGPIGKSSPWSRPANGCVQPILCPFRFRDGMQGKLVRLPPAMMDHGQEEE